MFGGSGEDATIHNFKLDLNLTGSVTIKIHSTGSGQATFDNFKWNEPSQGITANINQLLAPDNSLPITLEAIEYGQDVTVPVETESGENTYQFGVVNGIVKYDLEINNTFPITEGLDVSLVYANENNHAVLFVDSNGKLLSTTWVESEAAVTAPDTIELSKPGYEISETPWLSNEGHTGLDNINSSRVYTLQYELIENPVNISVNGELTQYAYNNVVTIESTNEAFTAWVEDGKVISTNKKYLFTALTDRVITESTTLSSEQRVTLSDDLKLRVNQQTFVGQIELLEG